ncbi:LOB domain-containing protein 37-like [Canna indica]|uniref:LOB domain-containing protein 37-like n=1 Tax=Canna indica TaxID=4628 RepID=A0AAQ3KUV6_9LILI|nr:LOB domain-containing protein 37-like [Canna indica]
MSCNGCRVLRKGCGDACALRACLQWINTAEAQGHATIFVAKFFGRAGLMSFASAASHRQRPALFQSLLFEAVGRTINPVGGAVGLLWSGNWHLCLAGVDSVLRGGVIGPLLSIPPAGARLTAACRGRQQVSGSESTPVSVASTLRGREGGGAAVVELGGIVDDGKR